MTSTRWPPSSNLLKKLKQFIKNACIYKFYKWGIKMTSRNSLTHVRSTHSNMEDNSKHIRKNMSILCEKNMFSLYGTCAHLQLPTFRSDIIWIMSNEIILLLLSFNLITTSFRYHINYFRNLNLNMVGVCRHISKWPQYVLVKYYRDRILVSIPIYFRHTIKVNGPTAIYQNINPNGDFYPKWR
jgi:hypothetical protein